MTRAVSGLVPIVATPFDDAGRLDEESLQREVEYLIQAGVDGITMFGVAGEFYAVTDEERERGVRLAVEQARARVAVIAGTGHTGTEVAAYLSARAAAAGADAVMVIMPFFVKPDAAGAHLPEEMAVGSQGTMPAALMPEVYGAIWRAYQTGEAAHARRLFDRYFPLIRLTNQPGLGPRMVKLLLQRAGIIRTAYVRGPAPALDAPTERALLETADALDLWNVMAKRAAPAA